MLFSAVVVVYLVSLTEATYYCEEYCSLTEGCESSYCKENGVCFGLYYDDATTCYQPGDGSGNCDDATLSPVMCDDKPPVTSTASTTSMWTCSDVCNALVSCQESTTGSYCKTWISPSVCFGIIVKPDGTLCYEGVDEGCEGEPYECDSAMTTDAPTEAPTDAPTEAPTDAPTEAPTDAPTEAPTDAPTEAPTDAPTEAPTDAPTEAPTDAPTEAPTDAPTEAPTDAPTEAPTEAPTAAPTEAPAEAPTDAPTEAPTDAPTEAPTAAPTEAPTGTPTDTPTEAPTDALTEAPTDAPTEAPTDAPTEAPTDVPQYSTILP